MKTLFTRMLPPMRALKLRCFVAALSGALLSFTFLPFDIWASWSPPVIGVLPVLILLPLCYFWLSAENGRAAFYSGLFFGAGLFITGVHWVYISLTTFGGMPAPVALVVMAFFMALLSLFPALTGYLVARYFYGVARLVALPALWGLSELLRGVLFSGFPWLSLGYTQAATSPFAGYLPLGGVYLASMMLMAVSALVVAIAIAKSITHKIVAGGVITAIVAGGWGLGNIEWTTPNNTVLPVTLIQGNITQDIKFLPSLKDETYRRYAGLLAQSQGQLILLPESAFPDFLDLVPETVIDYFTQAAAQKDANILLGVFTYYKKSPVARDEYYNSIISLGRDTSQVYKKRHLVLFGEKIPFEDVIAPIMNSLIAIPLAGQSAGDENQPPFTIGDEKVAVSICFEDAFGAEQRARVAQSTLLANFTNDAWFAQSVAAWQHHRIASTRALESARPMLRVTNTGITAVINHKGQTEERLPWFTTGVLEAGVVGRRGNTFYLIAGDATPFALSVLLLGAAVAVRRVRPPRQNANVPAIPVE